MALPNVGVLADFSIEPSSTVDQIVQGLSAAILRGELTPGTRVRESALAAQLKVSRNTVREAVLVLQQTGLVLHVVNRGAVVRPIDPEAVADLYRVREVLELTAVSKVTGETDLGPVAAALEVFAVAAASGDVHRTVECDLAFHGSLVALLRSPRLDAYFTMLRGELRYYLAAISREHRESDEPDALVEQHAVVYRALERRDISEAHRLLEAHIELNARLMLTLLATKASR